MLFYGLKLKTIIILASQGTEEWTKISREPNIPPRHDPDNMAQGSSKTIVSRLATIVTPAVELTIKLASPRHRELIKEPDSSANIPCYYDSKPTPTTNPCLSQVLLSGKQTLKTRYTFNQQYLNVSYYNITLFCYDITL